MMPASRLQGKELTPQFILPEEPDLFSQQPADLLALQPRLQHVVTLFRQESHFSLFVIAASEPKSAFRQLAPLFRAQLAHEVPPPGGQYEIAGNYATFSPAISGRERFSPIASFLAAEFPTFRELFGAIDSTEEGYQLIPGIIHAVNGGMLLLRLSLLLHYPRWWNLLEQILVTQSFSWPKPNLRSAPSLTVAPMPMKLRLLLLGSSLEIERFEFQMESLRHQLLYGELEEFFPVSTETDLQRWMQYVKQLALNNHCPFVDASGWQALLRYATRYAEYHDRLPLDAEWIIRQLVEARCYSESKDVLTAEAFTKAAEGRCFREGAASQSSLEEIEKGFIHIATEGTVIGQANGLAVFSYPGQANPIAEPCRISCVTQAGEGEFTDVEHKVSLAGNLHAKGILILQAYLISTLDLQHPLPFIASIVFEQSYSEVDGDSASLAGLCALISSLARVPLKQSIALTGAIDQFGQLLPIGAVNTKIEGFFALCYRRGLTGEQGVLIPESNVQQLTLSPAICSAVEAGQFHIWKAGHVGEVIQTLTDLPYEGNSEETVLGKIRSRIASILATEEPQRFSWWKWLTTTGSKH